MTETAPSDTGVQVIEYGKTASEPMLIPFTKNSTEAIEPSASEAVAVKVVAEFTGKVAPAVGLVTLTVGPPTVTEETFTTAAVDVAELPPRSVAFAVKLTEPNAVGVHAIVYGNVVSEPRLCPFAKNCTEAIVPSASAAVACKVVGVLTVTVAPLTGLVSDTVGETGLTVVTDTVTLLETP